MMSEVPIRISKTTIVCLAPHDVILGDQVTLTVLVLSLANGEYLLSHLAS